jgi:hypothetical protein
MLKKAEPLPQKDQAHGLILLQHANRLKDLLLAVGVQGSNHQRLAFLNRRLFRAVKFDVVTVNSSTMRSKLRLDQDAFQISCGLKLVRSENHGTASVRILANFGHFGIKTWHNWGLVKSNLG